MALVCGAFFGASVATRIATHGTYHGVDVGLEGSFVLGLVGGYVTGLAGGILIALPAMFENAPITILLFAAVGVLGGILRDVAPEPEDIWRFSPLFDWMVFRLFRKKIRST